MSWNTLNTQIYNLIDANKATLGIQEVYSYPKLKFTGYPSVNITPSENSNDYETTTENLRIYAFYVRVFYETADTGIEGALNALKTLADSMLDMFDQDNEKNMGRVIGVGLPARYTYIQTLATPGIFAQVESENIVFCELKIQVKVSIDVV